MANPTNNLQVLPNKGHCTLPHAVNDPRTVYGHLLEDGQLGHLVCQKCLDTMRGGYQGDLSFSCPQCHLPITHVNGVEVGPAVLPVLPQDERKEDEPSKPPLPPLPFLHV